MQKKWDCFSEFSDVDRTGLVIPEMLSSSGAINMNKNLIIPLLKHLLSSHRNIVLSITFLVLFYQ